MQTGDRRLLRDRRSRPLGLLEGRCATCALAAWQGRPLSLALHHATGDGQDNRLENLQLPCPNCHGQTENFARAQPGPVGGVRATPGRGRVRAVA